MAIWHYVVRRLFVKEREMARRYRGARPIPPPPRAADRAPSPSVLEQARSASVHTSRLGAGRGLSDRTCSPLGGVGPQEQAEARAQRRRRGWADRLEAEPALLDCHS